MPTLPTLPANYYNRFDRTKEYDRHLFLPGPPLQSAELNEVQSNFADMLGLALSGVFANGNVLSGAGASISSGTVTAAAGVVFADGAARSVGSGTFSMPTTSTHYIGIRLYATVITSADDNTLLNPVGNPATFGVPGASRLKVHVTWGWEGDGNPGDFFPVYTVIAGVIQTVQAPYVLRTRVDSLGAVKPLFSVHKNGTTQTIPTAVATLLTWATKLYDTAGWFANNRWQPEIPGYYQMNVVVNINNSYDTHGVIIWIYKNGTPFKKGNASRMASNTDGLSVGSALSTIVQANGTTDYFEVYVYQDNLADNIVNGNAEETHFSGHYICPLA